MFHHRLQALGGVIKKIGSTLSLVRNPVVIIMIVIAVGLALAAIPFMISVQNALRDAMVSIAQIVVIIALVWAFSLVK